MGTGFLEVVVAAVDDALPIAGARVTVLSGDSVLYELVTDESGQADGVALEAPDKALTLDVNYEGIPYSVCDVRVEADNFRPVIVRGVEILDTETSILPVHMHLRLGDDQIDEIDIPPHNLVAPGPRRMEMPTEEVVTALAQYVGRIQNEVIIPEFITVHLGRPDQPGGRNVRVPFTYYVKNSASHEIFSTWPPASLEANIYCITSLALNRIFTVICCEGGYQHNPTYL